MSLASEYQRQFAWRDWPTAFGALPTLAGQVVLDLGCGIGDQAAELVARGARVIGVDANEALLDEARARRLPNTEFRRGDLRALDLDVTADGLWSSFTAAYFPDFTPVLQCWKEHLRPGGWIALTEVNDLFAHEPLTDRTRSLLGTFARDASVASRYDFHMGGKLQAHLGQAGFLVSKALSVADRELAFDGAADPGVIDAWRARFDRMQLLREFCGPEFEHAREEFLACLARADHSCRARVCICLATAPA